jgi:hypothetical protein
MVFPYVEVYVASSMKCPFTCFCSLSLWLSFPCWFIEIFMFLYKTIYCIYILETSPLLVIGTTGISSATEESFYFPDAILLWTEILNWNLEKCIIFVCLADYVSCLVNPFFPQSENRFFSHVFYQKFKDFIFHSQVYAYLTEFFTFHVPLFS